MNNNLSVLLVDDEPDLSATLKVILEGKGGFTVETASSVEVAAKMLGVKSFDVVVSDYQMPGKDGLQFLKELRGRGDSTPFIVLTGRGREEVAIQALNLGADRYLQKGGDIESMYTELTDAINNCVKSKRLEKALRLSEERYRSFFETSRDLVFITSKEGALLEMNDAGIEMLGYGSREEMMNVKVPDLYANREDREKFMVDIGKQGFLVNYPVALRRKDGTVIHTLYTAMLRRNEKGEIVGYQGTVKNITERKQAEETLRESERRFRELVESLPEMVIEIDTDANIKFANTALFNTLGYSREELAKLNAFQFIAPEDHAKLKENYAKIFRGEKLDRSEYTALRKDGSRFPIITHSQLITDGKGNTLGLRAIVMDVTKLVKTEAALRASEERYRNLVNNMCEGLYTLDVENKFSYVNPSFAEMLGYGSEEFLGKNVFNYLPKEEVGKVREELKKRSDGVISRYELTWLKRNEQPIHTLISASPILKDGKHAGSYVVVTNLSGQKKILDTLTESEARSKALLGAIPDLVFRLSSDGVFLDFSSKTTEELYLKPENFIGKKIGEVMPSEVAKLCLQYIGKAIESGDLQIFEYSLPLPQGRQDYEARLTVCGSNEVLAIVRNITKRKRAEEAVRSSEERYRTLFEFAPEGIVTLDMKGVVTSINTTALKISGYSEDEIVGKHFSKLGILHARDIPRFLKLSSSILREQSFEPVEMRYHHKDGTPLIAEARATLIKVEGKPVGIQIALRDITERKNGEEALRESEERYRSLVEYASAPIGTIDMRGRFTYVNKAFSELLGYPVEELLSHSFRDLLHPKDMGRIIRLFINIMLLRREPRDVDFRVIRKSGEILHLMTRPTRIRMKDKTVGFQCILTDLTKISYVEEEKLQATSEAAKIIGHDIRNPLQAIRNAAYLLKDEVGEKGQEMLEMINRNIDAADKIVIGLRDLMEVLTLHLTKEDMNKLLREVTSQTVLPEGVKLSTSYGHIPHAKLDRAQLSRVFQNLVKNALEAMPEGGELTITTSREGNFIEVAVKDTGVGISKANLQKLFTPFFTTKAKGTGLGLANAKRVVEAHGGIINVESEKGKGATIIVRLPTKS